MPPGDAATGHAQDPGTGGSAGPARGSQAVAAAAARISSAAPPKITGMRRWALGNLRIRTRLVVLLVLPVVAAIVLGALRINTALANEAALTKVSELSNVAQAATTLADQLENERDASAIPLTRTGNLNDDGVRAAQQQTQRAQQAFVQVTSSIDLAGLPGGGTDIATELKDLQKLPDIRKSAFPKGGGNGGIQLTVNQYDYLIQGLISLTQDMALGSDTSSLITSGRALEQFSTAKEYASIERAMLAGVLATPDQKISPNDLAYLSHANSQMTNSVTAFKSVMANSQATDILNTFENNNNVKTSRQFLNEVLTTGQLSGAADGMTAQTWYDNASTQVTAMTSAEQDLVHRLDLQAKQLKTDAQAQTLINSIVIALVLIVAVLGAMLVGRSMVRTLRRLQKSAEDVAQHRLPELVRTLSEADPQDVDVSVAPIGINSQDEIGHVAHAFDKVHSEAVRLAAEQALLRGNINAMFTNLSRRSQGLIQRQISLISELESREADPDQLASLFKLDHLATRMRRNGENLLVLAGEDPGRRWTRPVPLVDVLRAAASEVEQYERIELASVPTTDVIGRVVNDLVHLLAELLENATSFSSPQTRVKVTGHALPDGRVLVEIHDTGIGLSPDDLADINERLANPPVVDVSVSRRMGLFVVGRLSLRHGIRIQLRPSDSGGTTALVMLPVDITNAGRQRAEKPGQGGPGPLGRGPAGGPAGNGRALPTRGGEGGAGGLAAAFGGAAGARASQGGPGAGAPGGSALPGRGAAGALGPGRGADMFGGAQNAPSAPNSPNAPGAPSAPAPSSAPGGAGGGRGDLPVRGRELPSRGGQESGLPTGGLPTRGQNGGGQNGGGLNGGAPSAGGLGGDTGEWTRPQDPAANGRVPEQGYPTPPQPTGYAPQQPEQPSEWTRRADPAPAETSPFAERTQHAAAGPDPRQSSPEIAPQGLPSGMRGSRYPGQDPQQGQFGQHSQAGQPGQGGQPGQPGQPGQQRAESTLQFSRPLPPAPPVPEPAQPQQAQPQQSQAPAQQMPQQMSQQTPQQQRAAEENDPLTGRMALPPAESGGSPIFEAMESTWFRSGRADRMRAVQVTSGSDRSQGDARDQQSPAAPSAPAAQSGGVPNGATGSGSWQARQQSAGAFPAQPQAQAQSQAAYPAAAQAPGMQDAPWRPSANDDRWQRASAVRSPSTSGTTPSGLPRRVPSANLVPGTAEAASIGGTQIEGPQVDRSPDQVRGRLSSLHRGVRQGRQAREGGNEYGNNNGGNGPYGPERQER